MNQDELRSDISQILKKEEINQENLLRAANLMRKYIDQYQPELSSDFTTVGLDYADLCSDRDLGDINEYEFKSRERGIARRYQELMIPRVS